MLHVLFLGSPATSKWPIQINAKAVHIEISLLSLLVAAFPFFKVRFFQSMLSLKLIYRRLLQGLLRGEKHVWSVLCFLFFCFVFPCEFQILQYCNVDNISLKDKRIPTSPKCIFFTEIIWETIKYFFFLSFYDTFSISTIIGATGLERAERGNPRKKIF